MYMENYFQEPENSWFEYEQLPKLCSEAGAEALLDSFLSTIEKGLVQVKYVVI